MEGLIKNTPEVQSLTLNTTLQGPRPYVEDFRDCVDNGRRPVTVLSDPASQLIKLRRLAVEQLSLACNEWLVAPEAENKMTFRA
jgi:hypothetical protein